MLKPSFAMETDQAIKSSTSTRGHPVYDSFIANIVVIHSIFIRAMGNHLTEECVTSMFEEWPAIEVANQYFTPKAIARLENI